MNHPAGVGYKKAPLIPSGLSGEKGSHIPGNMVFYRDPDEIGKYEKKRFLSFA